MNLLIVPSLKPFLQPSHFTGKTHQANPSVYPFTLPFVLPLFIHPTHPSSIYPIYPSHFTSLSISPYFSILAIHAFVHILCVTAQTPISPI